MRKKRACGRCVCGGRGEERGEGGGGACIIRL